MSNLMWSNILTQLLKRVLPCSTQASWESQRLDSSQWMYVWKPLNNSQLKKQEQLKFLECSYTYTEEIKRSRWRANIVNLVTKLTTALCRRSRCTVYFYLHIYRYFVNHWYIWANVDSSLLTISNTILSLRGVYLQILTAFSWKQASNHHLSFSSQFFSYF